jgi:hypothetical protein
MYEYRTADGTLAGLSTSVPLSEEDRVRLGLVLVDSGEASAPGGAEEVFEDWRDAGDLAVSTSDGRIFTVEADDVSCDGVPMHDWTAEDCVRIVGGLVHTEEVTDDLRVLHLDQGHVLIYIGCQRFQSISLIDRAWNVARLQQVRDGQVL